jgi:hypothetical protein
MGIGAIIIIVLVPAVIAVLVTILRENTEQKE